MSTGSPILDLCDAIVAALNTAPGGTFVLPFTSARELVPETTLADNVLRVQVIPESAQTDLHTRGSTLDTYTVRIVVREKQPAPPDIWLVEERFRVVQQITDYLRKKTMAGCAWTGGNIDPLFGPENLTEERRFSSVVTLTYRRDRSI